MLFLLNSMSNFSIDASTLATLYVCALGLAFMLRYRQGKWKKMRVIDAQPVVVEVRCREASVVE